MNNTRTLKKGGRTGEFLQETQPSLWHQDPLHVPVWFLATLFPIWILPYAPRNCSSHSRNGSLGSGPPCEPWICSRVLAPGFSPADAWWLWPFREWNSKWMVCVCVVFSVTLILTKQIRKKESRMQSISGLILRAPALRYHIIKEKQLKHRLVFIDLRHFDIFCPDLYSGPLFSLFDFSHPWKDRGQEAHTTRWAGSMSPDMMGRPCAASGSLDSSSSHVVLNRWNRYVPFSFNAFFSFSWECQDFIWY